MTMQKRLGVISLVWSGLFVLIIGVEFLGILSEIPIYFIIWPFEFLFSWPLYIFVFVSFLVTGYIWIRDMNKDNFKYFLYSSLSGFMVVGTLFAILISFAKALENF